MICDCRRSLLIDFSPGSRLMRSAALTWGKLRVPFFLFPKVDRQLSTGSSKESSWIFSFRRSTVFFHGLAGKRRGQADHEKGAASKPCWTESRKSETLLPSNVVPDGWPLDQEVDPGTLRSFCVMFAVGRVYYYYYYFSPTVDGRTPAPR